MQITKKRSQAQFNDDQQLLKGVGKKNDKMEKKSIGNYKKGKKEVKGEQEEQKSVGQKKESSKGIKTDQQSGELVKEDQPNNFTVQMKKDDLTNNEKLRETFQVYLFQLAEAQGNFKGETFEVTLGKTFGVEFSKDQTKAILRFESISFKDENEVNMQCFKRFNAINFEYIRKHHKKFFDPEEKLKLISSIAAEFTWNPIKELDYVSMTINGYLDLSSILRCSKAKDLPKELENALAKKEYLVQVGVDEKNKRLSMTDFIRLRKQIYIIPYFSEESEVLQNNKIAETKTILLQWCIIGQRFYNLHKKFVPVKSKEEKEEILTNPHNDIQMIKSNSISENCFDTAIKRLQLNAFPDMIPCRTQEMGVIRTFLEHGIRGLGSSTSLYIAGMPGTGKTLTTLQVIQSFREQVDFVQINAMALINPNLVYTIIFEKLTGKRVKPTVAAENLDEIFKYGNLDRKRILVVLVDELDCLVTNKQTLLYNLFEWPCLDRSKLLVIAIANRMDLPEKLQPKIASRMGQNRLVYEPYSRDEVSEILTSRIKDIRGVFDQKSLGLIATKISNYSGDIRRSLQITKRAVEICQAKEAPYVTYEHVLVAFQELFESKTVQVLCSLKQSEVILVLAVYVESIDKKCDKLLLGDVQDRFYSLLKQLQFSKIQHSLFLQIVKRMQAFGVLSLTIDDQKLVDNQFVAMRVYDDELAGAFKDREYVQRLAQNIHSLEELFKI